MELAGAGIEETGILRSKRRGYEGDRTFIPRSGTIIEGRVVEEIIEAKRAI